MHEHNTYISGFCILIAWKCKNISVLPGHRVILSQFIEKVKQRISLTTTITHKRDTKRTEVRCKYSKKVKVEERQTDHVSSQVSANKAHLPNNLLDIAGKNRKQIVKWQNSQKEMQLKQFKEHKDYEIKVQSVAGPVCFVDVSFTCKIYNISSTLGMHDKPNSFFISNWTCHVKFVR